MRDLYFATQSKKKVVMNATPYIESGRWKIFDKTYQEQTEADKIIFDGFFSAIRKHHNFLQKEKRCISIPLNASLDEATEKTSVKLNSTPHQIKKLLKKLVYHLALKFTLNKSSGKHEQRK